MNDLLPVGSVVELKDKRELMIIGFYPIHARDNDIYDYICCKKRVGLQKRKELLVQDRDYFYVKKEDVVSVKYIGFSDKRFDVYEKVTKEINKELFKAKLGKEELSEEDIQEVYKTVIDNIYRKRRDLSER